MTAINALIAKINTGDMDTARQWAADNNGALWLLRSSSAARAMVAHACNRWGASMVWPWGDRAELTAAERRVLTAIRSGTTWRASEDTIATLLAYGEIRAAESGGLVAA